MMRPTLRGNHFRRGGQAWAWLLIGLLLGGGVGATTAYFLKPGKTGLPGGPKLGNAEELALVPADAVGFVHIRARDLWKSEEMFSLLRKLVDKAGAENLNRLDEAFAPKLSTVDRVTLVVFGSMMGQMPPPALGLAPPPKDPNAIRKLPRAPANQPPQPEAPLIRGPGNIEFVGVLSFTEPYDPVRVRSTLMPAAAAKQVAGKELWDDPAEGVAAFFASPTVLVIGSSSGVNQFLNKQPAGSAKKDGPLTGSLEWAARGGHYMVAAVNAEDFHINLARLTEVMPSSLKLKDAVKLAHDAEPILHAEAFAYGATLGGPDPKVDLKAYYKDDAAAEHAEKAALSMAETLRGMLDSPRHDLEDMLKGKAGPNTHRSIEDQAQAVAALIGIGAVNHLDEYLAKPPLKRDGRELIVSLELPSVGATYMAILPAAAGMLFPAVSKVRDAAVRTMGSNNLKQIGLAMHSYHDSYQHFPLSSSSDKKGGGQLSWRVHILPFIEQQRLYDEFHLDEPWDSEHNQKLIGRMPPQYASASAPLPPGETYYKVFTGKQAIFGPGKKTKMSDITDGTSNTILAVEGGKPVIWTKPEDIPFDPAQPLPDLSLPGSRQIQVLMADGSTRTIDLDKVSEKTLKAAVTINGGEVLGLDW